MLAAHAGRGYRTSLFEKDLSVFGIFRPLVDSFDMNLLINMVFVTWAMSLLIIRCDF